MKSWFSRSMSSGSSSKSHHSGTAARQPGPSSSFNAHLWPSRADPTTWREAFQSHWFQAYGIIQSSNDGSPSAEQVSAVFNHLDQMFLLLLTEANSQDERAIGPILDYFFTEDILSEVVRWIFNSPPSVQRTSLLHMLKLYEGLVTQSYQCLLVHKPILHPLLKVLESCNFTSKNSSTDELEKHFVLLLNQICTKIADDSTLLEFFFNRSGEEGSRFLVFTLMIPYLYEDADIGQLARDAMLLILAVSMKIEFVGHFIAEHTNFCPVLATGLSGCFSQLPRRLTGAIAASDDWHGITMTDIEAIPSLQSFYSSLVFCNAVVQVGHSFVLEQLLDYIYHGFLVSVVCPALFESGLEELISGTAYLDLCFRTVTEPALMKIFLRFIVSEQYDGKRVLETLVERINSTSRLCLMSLALFSTLLQLNCEDLMLELVLKYLIPCTHIMASQSHNLREVDYYGKTAESFLSLIPKCCKTESNNNSSSVSQRRPSNETENSKKQPLKRNDFSESPQYIEYLMDARQRIQSVYKGCACWALPYDGENPEPELFREVGSVRSSSSTSPVSSPRSVGSRNSGANSLRRSRPNSYFTRRHTSGVSSGGGGGAVMTSTDLAVLGPEEFEDFFAAEVSSPSSESGAANSVMSTPRFEKGFGASTDYFKLAFDEDLFALTSDSQGEESDHYSAVPTERGSHQMSASFILRGWTEVEDLNTFIEVLNRVRTAHEASTHSLEDNLKFLERRCDGETEDEKSEAIKSEEELVESKDSGIGEILDFRPEEKQVPELRLNGDSPPATEQEESATETEDSNLIPDRRDPAEIPVSFRSSFSAPTLGPFLGSLLEKMDSMVHNTLYINLQLTGVISQLARYPQPLLNALLLNPALVFQPSIRSLFQILGSLKHKMDSYAYSVSSLEGLLVRGRKHLYSREKRFFSRRDRSCSEEKSSTGSGSQSDVLSIQMHGSKPRSFSEMFHLSSSPDKRANLLNIKPRSSTIETGTGGLRNHRFYHHKSHQSPETSLEAIRTKNMVYCAIVLEEFLKELAAISQEHAVAFQFMKHK